ncbi:putative thiazole-containing bacteriocin maturation protein [Neobacillus sp. K501]
MANLNPSMRLKVKRDTFFLPDSNLGVYFRNNVSSFRMEGSMIDKWVEKLIPMFNGEYTMEFLTNELPGPYRDRVYEIAATLYQNGFVRDVSQDQPHQLNEQVLKKYASQIEFVDNLVDSGAFRFQNYRQAKVLAIGAGPLFISLVSSLLESGLPKFQMLITDTVQTNRKRLMELVAHARNTDDEVEIVEITRDEEINWQEVMKPFEYILYVSEHGDVEELRFLHRVCREVEKVFLPAISLEQLGLAGPLVYPNSEACWESAWRRLHQSALTNDQRFSSYSPTAGALLANVSVFELFKHVTGVSEKEQSEKEQKNQFFLFDFETLEGNWHPFQPHPLVTGKQSTRLVENITMRPSRTIENEDQHKLLLFFNQLTSKVSGIFHIWEEGDLNQLPLAQCRVQSVDPITDGPAELLQDLVCTGLTHEEARREAGLSGIEKYLTKIVTSLNLSAQVEIGAGESLSEGICRGLQRCLDQELKSQLNDPMYSVSRVELCTVDDDRCRFYLQALKTMQRVPTLGIGKDVSGFPVVWIGTQEGWYGSSGLNITLALRNALQQALAKAQNQENIVMPRALEVSSILLDEKAQQSLDIPACDERFQSEHLQSAMEILERNNKKLLVYELELEPYMKKELAGLCGVLVQEEGSS